MGAAIQKKGGGEKGGEGKGKDAGSRWGKRVANSKRGQGWRGQRSPQ